MPKKAKKPGKLKKTNKPKRATSRKKGDVCEHSEKETCNKCLLIARELLLCGELDEKELQKVRVIMTKIITKKGVLKEEVKLLGSLSDAYLT